MKEVLKVNIIYSGTGLIDQNIIFLGDIDFKRTLKLCNDNFKDLERNEILTIMIWPTQPCLD